MKSKPLAITLILLTLAAIPSAFLACAREEAPRFPPNIVLITFDTMRADHLGCYGYARPTSPSIDAFADGATRYTRAMATSPWTVPSHASMFTGKFPFEHGAHTFLTGADTSHAVRLNPLDDRFVTLAEALKEEGYETGAFVANVAFLAQRWGVGQGFTTYHTELVPGVDLNPRIIDWLEQVHVREQEPFFLFVNYIDTHQPYNAAPRDGFLDPPAVHDSGQLLARLYTEAMPEDAPFPAELAQKVIDQYDTAVANVDEAFGRLMEELDAFDFLDSALVIVTSDHGEYFGEHHLVEHVKDIYQEVLWVPLIVKNPLQSGGKTEDGVMSSVDIPGLVLSQLPRDMAGRLGTVFPDAPGEHPVISEIYYSERKDVIHPVWGQRFRRVRTALYDWPFKFIRSSDEKHELFNLAEDGGEGRNRIEEDAGEARRLAAELTRYQEEREHAEGAPYVPPLTEEEKERLRSLGYSGN